MISLHSMFTSLSYRCTHYCNSANTDITVTVLLVLPLHQCHSFSLSQRCSHCHSYSTLHTGVQLLQDSSCVGVKMQTKKLQIFFSCCFTRDSNSCWTASFAALWLGQAAFFAQGNSNSLATIDISAGYVGLDDYAPTIVGMLTFLSTYCGPLLWYCHAVVFIVRQSSDIKRYVRCF